MSFIIWVFIVSWNTAFHDIIIHLVNVSEWFGSIQECQVALCGTMVVLVTALLLFYTTRSMIFNNILAPPISGRGLSSATYPVYPYKWHSSRDWLGNICSKGVL